MPDISIQEGAYNYAYLDEQTKRMIRRACLLYTSPSPRD